MGGERSVQVKPSRAGRDPTVDNGKTQCPDRERDAGKRAGTEVVQLYAADTANGITLPAQQLIGFARVELEPGARSITFAVPLSVLAYTGLSGKRVMESGPIEVSTGSSSSDIRSTATLRVTGKAKTIKGEERAFLSTAIVGAAGATPRGRREATVTEPWRGNERRSHADASYSGRSGASSGSQDQPPAWLPAARQPGCRRD